MHQGSVSYFCMGQAKASFSQKRAFFAVSLALVWTGKRCGSAALCLWRADSGRAGCFGLLLHSSSSCTHWKHFLLTFLLPHFHISVPNPQLSVAPQLPGHSCLLRQKGAFVGMDSIGSRGRKASWKRNSASQPGNGNQGQTVSLCLSPGWSPRLRASNLGLDF